MTDNAPDSARDRRARMARWVFVSAAAACALIVVMIALPEDKPIVPAAPPPSDLSIDPAKPATGGAGFDPIAAVLSGKPVDPAAMNAGPRAEPLGEPPAGLPVYEGARLMLGQQRRESRWLEQTAVYSMPAANTDPETVSDFYERAAERAGYTLKPAAGASPLDRVYLGHGGTLLVKTRTVGDEVRLTLILRAMTEEPAPSP